MLRPGLVSVTFRQLSITEIVNLAAQARLQGIEWGGDIHVPPGNLKKAAEARSRTLDHGLAVSSYGSYYYLGCGEDTFERVLETALALGAPTIRVWAGKLGSGQAGPEHRQRVVAESIEIATLAWKDGVTISYEYHPDTLTDTLASTRGLLEAARHPGLRTYWQAPDSSTADENRAALRALRPRLSNLHVYYRKSGGERRPLSEGETDWLVYLDILRQEDRRHDLLLEFVQDDSPEAFLRDAQSLNQWIHADD